MSALRTTSQALLLVVVFSVFCATASFPQSANLFLTSKSFHNGASPGVWRAKCATPSGSAVAGLSQFDEIGSAAFVDRVTGESNALNAAERVCLDSARTVKVDNPCHTTVSGGSTLPGLPTSVPCEESVDTVPGELNSLGKAGLKIEQAREEVLDILRSENGCSEWFVAKDAAAPATFRSLHFTLDQRGPQYVFELKNSQVLRVFQQPYVARAMQDGGSYSTITVNAYGAFFRPQGQVQTALQKGGPLQMDGTRLLTVGSYSGNTPQAQMVTLLHEFGHIIDLLPEDGDGMDGKSGQNTNEVLSHCRSEIDAHAKPGKQITKR